jgi:hypothetical protein
LTPVGKRAKTSTMTAKPRGMTAPYPSMAKAIRAKTSIASHRFQGSLGVGCRRAEDHIAGFGAPTST